MNKHMLSIVLLLTLIPSAFILASNQTILPGGCVRTDLNHEVVPEKLPWVQVNREFIIKTQIKDIRPPYDGWTLFKHDELELVDSDFMIDKWFIRTGHQHWIFKASRPGVYRMSFMLNGEIKTVSVYAYIEWCGTEPRSNATQTIHF